MRGIQICAPPDGDGQSVPLDMLLNQLTGNPATSHFIHAEIHYPPRDLPGVEPAVQQAYRVDNNKGYLIYIKPSLTGDEDVDLIGYCNENRVFPYDPTIDQFYDQRRFESYRSLGYHIGKKLCEQIDRQQDPPDRQRPWLSDWTPVPPPASPTEVNETATVAARLPRN